jgi:hypothetical protein
MRHFFLRDSNKFPVACIATEQTADNKIYYALSICNPRDFQCYDPERARHIAEERLTKHLSGAYENSFKKDKTPFDLAKVGRFDHATGENAKLSLLTLLAGDGHLPKRCREAASGQIVALQARLAEKKMRRP